MNRFLVLVSLLVLCCLHSLADEKYEELKNSLPGKLELLMNYAIISAYAEPEERVFYPDSLSAVISKELTDYLDEYNFDYFDVEDFPGLYYVPQDTEPTIKVLCYKYYSGGTAGSIPHSILIKYEGEFARVFDMEGEYCFFEFYKLKEELYLAVATTPGSGICRSYAVCLIDFSNGEAKIPLAFGNNKNFTACNSQVHFDSDTQLLTIEIDPLVYYDYKEYKRYLTQKGYRNFSITKMSDTDRYVAVSLKTKFDGHKFVKP